MKRIALTLTLLVAFFAVSVKPAEASIPTGTQIVLIFVAVGVVGAAIGVGIYYAARKSPSMTGCASSTSGGLSLKSEDNQQTYILSGDTTDIKAGDRIKVRGKRKKKDASGATVFIVDKLRKDFGACTVTP